MTKKDVAKAVKPKRISIPKKTRDEVFALYGEVCYKCGRTKKEHHKLKFEIDHILPVAEGGGNEIDNLRVLCNQCNKWKGKELTKEAIDQLTEVEIVDADLLAIPEWNPKIRTSDVKELADSISKVGLLYPLLVSSDNIVADGSRRLTAARMMGLKKIKVIRKQISGPELWAIANSKTKPITTKSFGIAYSQGLPIEYVPPRIRLAIEELTNTLGEEKALEALEKFGSNVWHEAVSVAIASGIVPIYKTRTQVLEWVMAGGGILALKAISVGYKNTGDSKLQEIIRRALNEKINIVAPGKLGEPL